jgi:hypothetical protein
LHAKDVGGYAIFGANYFCLAGVLLARKLTRGPTETSDVMGRSGMERVEEAIAGFPSAILPDENGVSRYGFVGELRYRYTHIFLDGFFA